MLSPANSLRLKKGKERPLLQKHHWIYSGAVHSVEASEGDLVEVFSFEGKRLGLAFYHPGHSIAAHMVAEGEESLEEALHRRLQEAISLRKALFSPSTNALRLVNAEGDRLPGLIVDSYAGHLVLQISHAGWESVRPLLVDLLIELAEPKSITEKSTSFLRKKEGLEEVKRHLYGEKVDKVEALENGLQFPVDLVHGQKTGFFLDQREMRSWVRSFAEGKRILNMFSYTGGFSLAALAGGALHVDSVDSSAKCKTLYEEALLLNGLEKRSQEFHVQDAFEFLQKTDLSVYDLLILDPPAFVKKRVDVKNAFRAYKELNRMALEKCRPNAVILTCSCSYHVGEELFQNIVFRAALEGDRMVRVIGRHRHALDHPISLFHPESGYLKSLLLHIV